MLLDWWRRCWTVLRLGRELRASRADLNEWQERSLRLGEKYNAELVRRVQTQLALRISEKELAEARAEMKLLVAECSHLRQIIAEVRVKVRPENYSLEKIHAKSLSEFRKPHETELP